MTTSDGAVAAAVERLKSFVEAMEDMSVEFSEPTTPAEIEALEAKYGLKLPPSYVRFISTFGTFKVHYGQELIGMEEPGFLRAVAPEASDAADGDDADVEAAIEEALFFQRQDDEWVDNFWCFNPRDRTPEGELGVVGYYHDEPFGLPQRAGTDTFRDFSAHIVAVIDDFIETYE